MKTIDESNWIVEKKERGPQIPLYEIEYQHVLNHRTKQQLKALILHGNDTINVIALTPDNELVMVRQLRFGISRQIVELPAGFIDHAEAPIKAAQRELVEETGYTTDKWSYLGYSYLNPSFLTNGVHHFLARDVHPKKSQILDTTEDIEILVMPEKKVLQMVRDGDIQDVVTIAALARYYPNLFSG